MRNNSSLGVLVVSYNPKWETLNSELKKIERLATIVLVDNASSKIVECDCYRLISLKSNYGIAAAQNRGLMELFSLGVTEVLFLDDDVSLSADKVEYLHSLFLRNQEVDTRIVIGPTIKNIFTGSIERSRFARVSDVDNSLLLTGQIINNGMICSMDAFWLVGMFDSRLFIDGVDHEFCWRLRSFGYKIYQSSECIIEHSIGEGDKTFFGVEVKLPSPVRVYYQYRNYVKLLRLSHVPFKWKMVNGFKYLLKPLLYYYFTLNLEYIKNSLNGFIDGFRRDFKI